MQELAIVTHVIVWVCGICTGIYFASQIEKGITKNINKDKNGD